MRDFFTEHYGEGAFDDPRNWVDGQFKPRKGFVRGYAFAQDVASVAPENIRDAAQNAYEERRARLQDQWRKDRREDADQTPPPPSFGAQAQSVSYPTVLNLKIGTPVNSVKPSRHWSRGTHRPRL
jgi:hypothetical protein